MSDTALKMKIYRLVFGWRGYWLALRSKLARQPYEASVRTPEGAIWLRLKTSDPYAYYKVLLNSDYDFPIPGSPKVIVDAGANIGLAAIYFARKYPEARIFAIEPERSNFELLQKNVRAFPNITPVRGALWNENTTIDLVDPGIGHWGFQVAEREAANQRLVDRVEALKVETMMARYGIEQIDVFKVDIEGAEKELFQNASSWIDRVGSIMIELHDRMKPGCTDAFTSATNDFPIEHLKGENVFRSRREFAPAAR
jgi:FkbM family methyltransferase